MKPVKLFYQERCPFCKKALRYIEELKAEYPEFQPIEIEMIEETQHPDIADQYDYYYVPTFYVDGVKAVSYTHLTLPTNREVAVGVGGGGG